MPEQPAAKPVKYFAVTSRKLKGVQVAGGDEIEVGPDRAKGQIPCSAKELELWASRGVVATEEEAKKAVAAAKKREAERLKSLKK